MALHRYGDFRVEVFYFDSPCSDRIIRKWGAIILGASDCRPRCQLLLRPNFFSLRNAWPVTRHRVAARCRDEALRFAWVHSHTTNASTFRCGCRLATALRCLATAAAAAAIIAAVYSVRCVNTKHDVPQTSIQSSDGSVMCEFKR